MKGRKGRSSERANEASFGRLLDAMGIFNLHIENSYGVDGLPDRYLGRGLWIEFKAILFKRRHYKGRPPALHNLLEKSQKRTIPKLIERGDTVHVCIFVHTEGEPTRFLIVPYERFLTLNEKELDEEAVKWTPTQPKTADEVRLRIGLPGS